MKYLKPIQKNQYSLLNSVSCAGSPSRGKNGSLSSIVCNESNTLTMDAHKNGAEQNAYPTTARILVMPSWYHGFAIAKSIPIIPSQAVRTASGGSWNTLMTTNDKVRTPKRYMDHPMIG